MLGSVAGGERLDTRTPHHVTARMYQSSTSTTPAMTLSTQHHNILFRVRSNSAVTNSRSRSSSVLNQYQKYYTDTTDSETRDQVSSQVRQHKEPVNRKQRLSTFSFRSRASSVSSFSSASSGSSSPSSPSVGSLYNTEVFWNKYRRQPDCSGVTNLLRRSRLRKLISKDKKYSSALELCSEVRLS